MVIVTYMTLIIMIISDDPQYEGNACPQGNATGTEMRKVRSRPSQIIGKLGCKMGDQKSDVITPIAQRWNRDRNDIQPEKQVFTKCIFCYQAAQVPVARRNDAHIDLLGFPGSDHADLLVLEKMIPKVFGLMRGSLPRTTFLNSSLLSALSTASHPQYSRTSFSIWKKTLLLDCPW